MLILNDEANSLEMHFQQLNTTENNNTDLGNLTYSNFEDDSSKKPLSRRTKSNKPVSFSQQNIHQPQEDLEDQLVQNSIIEHELKDNRNPYYQGSHQAYLDLKSNSNQNIMINFQDREYRNENLVGLEGLPMYDEPTGNQQSGGTKLHAFQEDLQSLQYPLISETEHNQTASPRNQYSNDNLYQRIYVCLLETMTRVSRRFGLSHD